MGATVERAMKRAAKLEARQLRGDPAQIKQDVAAGVAMPLR